MSTGAFAARQLAGQGARAGRLCGARRRSVRYEALLTVIEQDTQEGIRGIETLSRSAASRRSLGCTWACKWLGTRFEWLTTGNWLGGVHEQMKEI